MKDIAEDLGVSLMTVSKALRSHSDISEETRKRVMKRAQELESVHMASMVAAMARNACPVFRKT